MDEVKTLFSVDKQRRRTRLGQAPKRAHIVMCALPSCQLQLRQEGLGRERCHFNTILVKRHLVECPGKK